MLCLRYGKCENPGINYTELVVSARYLNLCRFSVGIHS
jgi:hypothetical protein